MILSFWHKNSTWIVILLCFAIFMMAQVSPPPGLLNQFDVDKGTITQSSVILMYNPTTKKVYGVEFPVPDWGSIIPGQFLQVETDGQSIISSPGTSIASGSIGYEKLDINNWRMPVCTTPSSLINAGDSTWIEGCVDTDDGTIHGYYGGQTNSLACPADYTDAINQSGVTIAANPISLRINHQSGIATTWSGTQSQPIVTIKNTSPTVLPTNRNNLATGMDATIVYSSPFKAPWAGSIVGVAGNLNAAPDAGTGGLHLYINGASVQQDVVTWSTSSGGGTAYFGTGRFKFNAGDTLALWVHTDGNWLPATLDLTADIYVLYDAQ